jgi:uncharacterized protein
MRWERGHESAYVDDLRGRSAPRMAGGGGAPMMLASMLIGRGKWATIVGLLILAFYFVGPMFMNAADTAAPSATATATAPVSDEAKQFVGFVLDDAQGTWQRLLPSYRPARLVLFTDRVSTACGMGAAAAGPFYCPSDEKVYIDLGFYQELSNRFGAKGDFAQAYVIGHEIGHHVQNVTGTHAQVAQLERGDPRNANKYSIATELQADCYAGVWAKSTNEKGLLEPGDVDEALRAAAAVGDDAIQRSTTGAVRPETWTHGSSADRSKWFKVGFESGDPRACDTF